jgi:hypothetical protein
MLCYKQILHQQAEKDNEKKSKDAIKLTWVLLRHNPESSYNTEKIIFIYGLYYYVLSSSYYTHISLRVRKK